VRANNEQYRHLVEGSADGFVVSRNGRLTFLNAGAVRLLGASSTDQLLGTPIVHLFHPQSRVRDAIEQLRLDAPARFEDRIVRQDGMILDVEVDLAAFETSDGPAIRLILRDIT